MSYNPRTHRICLSIYTRLKIFLNGVCVFIGVQEEAAGGAEAVGEATEAAAAGACLPRLPATTAAATAAREETTLPLQQEPG